MAAVVAKIESELVVIEFDAVTQETHTISATITDHPVEVGANVSDHARAEPDVLTLECVISNTPLSTAQQQRAIRLGTTTISSNSPEEMPDRAKISFAQLDFLRQTGALLSVVTGLKVYRNMVLQSVTVPRNARTSNGLHFTASFKAIRIVQNQFTRAPKTTKSPGKGKKIPTGPQTPVEKKVNRSRWKTATLNTEGKGAVDGFIDAGKGLLDNKVRP